MRLFKGIRKLQDFRADPIGFIVDTCIKIVINLVLPIPYAGSAVKYLRGPMLGCMASVVILGIMFLVIIATILVSVFLVPSGFFQQITSGLVSSDIKNIDEGFIQSTIPSQNPLGGTGMGYTAITAGFMDPAYFLNFGRNHLGIDFVPNAEYYKSSKTYLESKKVIVYATHTGTATQYVDSDGGETVEVTNNDSSLKTVYIHFKDVYVKTGDSIAAGTPLGEMGETGFTTGEHVHYEIHINDGANWLPVNPLTYIK